MISKVLEIPEICGKVLLRKQKYAQKCILIYFSVSIILFFKNSIGKAFGLLLFLFA